MLYEYTKPGPLDTVKGTHYKAVASSLKLIKR